MARMTRTQIMLEPRQMELLERAAKASGRSKSELVRYAIDVALDEEATARRRLEALHRFLERDRGEAVPEVLPRPEDWRERLHDRGPGGRGW
jgi:Arc/MetJ-type ribon-helix-helix transcriptional regulator